MSAIGPNVPPEPSTMLPAVSNQLSSFVIYTLQKQDDLRQATIKIIATSSMLDGYMPDARSLNIL